ncbi:MAG: DNA adenine methylase [Spirochaetaceae bacterium]|jgi:DNA adenine methylase|nr:DNA adenine methylase [Spirochaetaceae bacterium]
MRTPITYYGGKQNMTDIIVPLLPPHRLYCEPFAGGLAIFFAKIPSTEEIVNDLNSEMANFWEVLKTDFDVLSTEVWKSLHSRALHRQAGVVYNNPDMFDRVKRAWAVWMLTNISFNSRPDCNWGCDILGKRTRALTNKRYGFLPELSERLKNVGIENRDAVKVIRDNDAPDSLFYVDPPYVGADQGHYAGYTQAAFDSLLSTLSGIAGKFLLSSYPNNRLMKYARESGWYQLEIKMNNTVAAAAAGHRVEKIEVLTANYPVYEGKVRSPGLFD